jgi:pyruvate dehydrogenase E1 component beta subunit
MARKYLSEAMQEGLHEEMLRDPSVIVLGEDVELGVYGYTKGLRDEFGPSRVRNTPISEVTITGATLGAAMCGLRPVTDIMIANFLYTGMDQFANQVSKLRYMTGSQFDVPAVYVATMGGGSNIAAQHSDSPHSVFMNLGGIKIVVATTPYDAKGLFKTAIRDDNPVLFLVPVVLIGSRGEVPEEDYTLPFGVADVKQEGSDVTIVAIGSMVKQALKAAKQLDKAGVSAEVIDPRTLIPLDSERILESVAKTGRLVVADESREMCSAASEIAAMVAEQGFQDLKAPVKRVTAPNVPIPFSPPLEAFVIPDAARIADAAGEVARG